MQREDGGRSTGTRLKVVYIIASGRSGSTILGNVLGELDGFFHAGELRTLWGRGLIGGRLCGCGVPVRECDFWQRVLERALRRPDGGRADAAEINRMHERSVHLRYLPRMLASRRAPSPQHAALRGYVDAADRLYLAIGDVTGTRVIVDSSKHPADAVIARLLPDVDVIYVQLVRDPRAVAYSWQRRKASPGVGTREQMMRLTSGTSTRNWDIVNVAAEVIRRGRPIAPSLLIRYEDFVAHPRSSVEEILRLLGEVPRDLPFNGDHRVTLTPGHTAGGNPDRFRTGPLELRGDTEWLDDQARRDRAISTTLALPLLKRYGYPIVPGGRR